MRLLPRQLFVLHSEEPVLRIIPKRDISVKGCVINELIYKTYPKMEQPLDYNKDSKTVHPEADRLRKIGQFLEVAPILILAAGMLMQTQGLPYWRSVILLGGGISVAIYTIFSYFMFQLERYTAVEFTLGLFSAVLFPIGVSGLLFPAIAENFDFMTYCIYGCVALFSVSILLFIVNITDARASTFYRGLIARVMVVGAILFRLWY